MKQLVIAALLFVGSHFVLSSSPLRKYIVRALGERPFTGLFSILAAATIVWLVTAFRQAPRDQLLWTMPGADHLALTLMPVALLLLVGGLSAPNPTAVMMQAPSQGWQPRGILTVTRHPVMWALGLWAILHILANGDLAALIFFGAFSVLALAGTRAIDAKKRRTWPADSARLFFAATSNLPFLAIAQGRARFDWRGIGWKPLLIAAALTLAIVFWFHPNVIGAPLFS
ncbi:MAG TPA: NnrU family protein [Candidatus Cybelea sp.]|nr:NnrU family protein [Candidatus Cybelea sp.]